MVLSSFDQENHDRILKEAYEEIGRQAERQNTLREKRRADRAVQQLENEAKARRKIEEELLRLTQLLEKNGIVP